MPMKKWRSMDLFHFPQKDNPIMESLNRFAQISQSHANTLLRKKRLGSLSNVTPSDSTGQSPKGGGGGDEDGEYAGPPLIQRTSIIQKDERGYGFTVSGDKPVFVASVKPDGAAARAGVQKGDKIIKVNGKLVTSSNHTEVVAMIKAGSYVALTLFGKPASRESVIERDSSTSSFRESGSFRDSIRDKITGPQPVDVKRAEKERELRQQRLNTVRAYYEAELEEYEKLKRNYRLNPSDKLQTQLQEKEKTLKILEAQIKVEPDTTSLSSTDSTWTVSVPSAVSDISSISDSPHTSPSTSPTPFHSHNMSDTDLLHPDSGIEDGSQGSLGVSKRNSRQIIIGMEDDDFASEDESFDGDHRTKPPVSPFLAKLQSIETGDSKIFSDLKVLETKPAHMAIFLHYVLMNHNPAPLLFHQIAGIYAQAQGSTKDLKKWAYEIHSTFLIYKAPLKVEVDDIVINNIDSNLQCKSEKEEVLRALFEPARTIIRGEVLKLLEDLRQKKEQGLIQGSIELKDHMDKSEELKIVEKYLIPDLEKFSPEQGEVDEKFSAQGWALATFLRHSGLTKLSAQTSILERTQSFVSKDKRAPKFLQKQKSKNQKGHQFVLQHLYKQEFCMHCNKVLWGVGFQGYQCQTCELCVHKHCVDEVGETCSKKKKRISVLVPSKPKSQATPIYPSNPPKEEPAVSPNPAVLSKPQPLPVEKDDDLNALSQGGHSVNSIVSRFNNYNSNTQDTEPVSGKKGTEILRSESLKGKGDMRSDRPARRSKSDVDMDQNTLQAALTRSESSSASSISNRSVESPGSSMDTLIAQDDSDFDVEPELPSLKEVLGDETVRKLKPKEKKRQDVINELFYTEKSHVRNLKILDKLFYRPMLKEGSISQEFTRSLFPNLETMILLHSSLNNKMKERRKEKAVISTVGDILLERFDGAAGENFRTGCAIFCRNQSHMLETLKVRVRKEPKLAQLLSDSENNPLCQRLALKDIIPKEFMRLTKYPLLIENLLKYTPTNTEEHTNLERALQFSKQILAYVNQAVRECENHQRLIDLQRRIEKKLDNSTDTEDIKTFDLSKHKLIHDGSLIWRINNRKQIELHVVLLESAMVLLQKQEDKLVLKQQGTQLVAGKDEGTKRHSPLLWLNNVLARNDATDKRAFFVVNTSQSGPQIYQLVASSADEQKRWTKFITQASEAMKKNDMIQKKNPPADKLHNVSETQIVDSTAPGILEVNSEEEAIINVEGSPDSLVHPDSVIQEFTKIGEAIPVYSSLDEKLRQNDETLKEVLEERQNLIAELLHVEPPDVADRVKDVEADEDSVPQELIAACKHQTTQLYDMMKENANIQAQADDSGELTEDQLTVPIPMDRLRDMASRMNQILTNLLAAVNSRDDERDRLRRELKYAQEELNRLRKIQKAAAPLLDKDLISGRPASIVSEASTVSGESGDESREGEQVEEHEPAVNEEGMPGLPVEIEPEPEIVSEILNEKLNEVSPVTEDTIPDLDVEETTKTGILDNLGSFGDGDEDKEEPLSEVDPPDEDEIEDVEPPDKHINETMGDQEETESDQESDDEEQDEEEEVKDETDSGIPGTDLSKVENEMDKETDTDTFKTVADGSNSDNEQGKTESSGQTEQCEIDKIATGDNIKRDTSEEFLDAADQLDDEKDSKEGQDGLDQTGNLNEDSSDKIDKKDTNVHGDHEGTPGDPVEPCDKDTIGDSDTESHSKVTDKDCNANIENQVDVENEDRSKKADDDSNEQADVEVGDDTVTSLRTSSADTV